MDYFYPINSTFRIAQSRQNVKEGKRSEDLNISDMTGNTDRYGQDELEYSGWEKCSLQDTLLLSRSKDFKQQPDQLSLSLMQLQSPDCLNYLCPNSFC